MERVRSGAAQLVIGTHALLEDPVAFARLGLVIVDEQHRFGVLQRKRLAEKGASPDVLVMTATPIPRTLSLTLYGDLDMSVIDEMPPGRRPIETIWFAPENIAGVWELLRREVAAGRQGYVVYPVIEQSKSAEAQRSLKAAIVEYERLQKFVFPKLRLGLLHGRMRSEEKEKVMEAFRRGELQILVSTTVIEVGVDVPNATVMVIEHAERFGLSQLHQLRGRIGRGGEKSTCILVASKAPGEDARTRLETMVRDQWIRNRGNGFAASRPRRIFRHAATRPAGFSYRQPHPRFSASGNGAPRRNVICRCAGCGYGSCALAFSASARMAAPLSTGVGRMSVPCA